MVITGFSGAGKSQAMATFEDAGYFCVDNLPPEMIGSLAELFGHEGSKVERAAVASDVRGGDFFDGLVQGARRPRQERACPYRLLYLEADEHDADQPLQGDAPPPPAGRGRRGGGGAARSERELLAPLKERADVSIDTSDLSAARLRKVVADKMLPHGRARQARGHVHDVRLQARLAARRRPHLRRALPAEPPLRGRAARADRPRPGRDRTTSRARTASASSTSGSRRCSTTCCPPTSRRASRTSPWASAAPAAATARW